MHILSIIPTIVLACLTFSGMSQKTSVDPLFPAEVNDVIDGINAISFALRSLQRNFNLIGSKSVLTTLGALFNATDALTNEVRIRVQDVLAIPSEAAQNAVIEAETEVRLSPPFTLLNRRFQVVGNYQTLYVSLANHGGYDIVSKIYLHDVWAALKINALKVTDALAHLFPRQETGPLNNKLESIFAQADNAFKVGKIRG
ncbi:hypothetical protein MMC29_003791 [Sticta canariensis]|nr:hypothetical protein [Sticta canariensis]